MFPLQPEIRKSGLDQFQGSNLTDNCLAKSKPDYYSVTYRAADFRFRHKAIIDLPFQQELFNNNFLDTISLFYLIDNIHPFVNLAKTGMLTVEMLCILTIVADKKL